MPVSRLLSLLVCISLFSCQSIPEHEDSVVHSTATHAMSNLIIPESARSSILAQQALAKFNVVMMRTELAEAERAQFLFRRGLLFDSVGLDGLAFYDFQQALRFDPTLYEAYNSLGIHHTVRGEFIEAYDAFDAVVEMAPEYEFAYLNRAMALYYAKRYELSLPDIETYYHHDTQDTYRLLWAYIIASKIDKNRALIDLQQRRELMINDQWANKIVDFYLGNISKKSLLDSVVEGAESRNQLNKRLCEVYFYLGKYYRELGQNRAATNFFKLALSTNVFEFVEHRFARVEISAIRDANTQ